MKIIKDATPVYCPCGWKGVETELNSDYQRKPGGFVDEPVPTCPKCDTEIKEGE